MPVISRIVTQNARRIGTSCFRLSSKPSFGSASRLTSIYQPRASSLLCFKTSSRCFTTTEKKNDGDEETPGDGVGKDSNEGSEGDANASADAASVDLQEKLTSLEAEVKELKEQILRSYAEEENVRRIAKRDIANAKVCFDRI